MHAESNAPADGMPSEPDAIRAEMVKTRAALSHKLDVLRSVVLAIAHPSRKGAKKTMVQKKAKAATAASKKTAAAKKPTSAKRSTAAKKGAAKRTVKRTANKIVDKAKGVLGDMLAGAAVGALKGAAEAVPPLPKMAAKGGKKMGK